MPPTSDVPSPSHDPIEDLRLARAEWRVQQMRLEDEIETLKQAKATFDAAYSRAMAQWERTVSCCRRWRDAARVATGAPVLGDHPFGGR